jgi:hypothetical protein
VLYDIDDENRRVTLLKLAKRDEHTYLNIRQPETDLMCPNPMTASSWRYSDHPRLRRNASTSFSFAIQRRRRPQRELGPSAEEEEEGDHAQVNIQGDSGSPGTAVGGSFLLFRPWR